jgi:DNA-binding response OmpR family regulator
MQLVPHLLLRADAHTGSTTAIQLRDAGYLVTKLGDDQQLIAMAAATPIDGIVIDADVPAISAISFVRRLRETLPAPPPVLVITRSPDVVRRAAGVSVLHPREASTELVTSIDLMVATHELAAMM